MGTALCPVEGLRGREARAAVGIAIGTTTTITMGLATVATATIEVTVEVTVEDAMTATDLVRKSSFGDCIGVSYVRLRFFILRCND